MGKQRVDTSERLSLHLITDSLSESRRIEKWKEPWLLTHGGVTPGKIRLKSVILSFDGVMPVKDKEEKGTTEGEMVGWHHELNGHEFEQAPGDVGGHRSLACCRPRVWTQLNDPATTTC